MSLSLSQIAANAAADAANVRPGVTNAVSGGCCGDAPRRLVIGVFFDGTGNNMIYDRGQTDQDLRWEAWRKPAEEYAAQARVEAAGRAEQAAMEREAAARARATQLEAEAATLRAQETQAKKDTLVWQSRASKASNLVRSGDISQVERHAAAMEANYWRDQAEEARHRAYRLHEQAGEKEQAAKAARREAEQAGRERQEKAAERKRLEDACYPCGPGKSSITNVVKLHDLYPLKEAQYKYRVYLRGVGTVENATSQDDYTTVGLGMGAGVEGGQSRIEQARSDIQRILKLHKKCPIDSVTFDIFGFSRGAALARHFVNVVLYGLPDYRQKAQPAKGEQKNAPLGAIRLDYVLDQGDPSGWNTQGHYMLHPALANVKIRFVGLFDTVGSFYWPGNADEGSFNTHLPAGCADKIFHILAAHERRKNFRFTSVLPGDGEEVVLAGAHSDIGGGYELYEKKSLVMDTASSAAGLGLQKKLLQRAAVAGALTPAGELRPGWSLETQTIGGKGGLVRMWLVRMKYTCNRYAHVALHLMHQKAKAAGVPLDPLGAENPLHQVPADAQHLVNAPQPAVSVDFWEKYVHVSATDDTPELPYAHMPRGRKDDNFGMWLDGGPIDPRRGFPNHKGGGTMITEPRTAGVGYGRRLRG